MKSVFSVYKIFLIPSLIVYGYWPTDLGSIHKTDILSKTDQSVYSVTSNLQSQKELHKVTKTFKEIQSDSIFLSNTLC